MPEAQTVDPGEPSEERRMRMITGVVEDCSMTAVRTTTRWTASTTPPAMLCAPSTGETSSGSLDLTDMGYVLDWELVDGVPRGCSAFKTKRGRGDDMTAEDFRSEV